MGTGQGVSLHRKVTISLKGVYSFKKPYEDQNILVEQSAVHYTEITMIR